MWEVTQEEGEAQEIVAALYRQTTEAKPRTPTCLPVKLRYRVSLPERAKYSSCRQPSTAPPPAEPSPPPSSLSHLMNGLPSLPVPRLPAVSCAQILQAFVVLPRNISILKPQSTCFAVHIPTIIMAIWVPDCPLFPCGVPGMCLSLFAHAVWHIVGPQTVG